LHWTILFLRGDIYIYIYIYIYGDLALQVGGCLEYLHHTPASSDIKGTHCPGVQLCHPVPGGYKYGNLALQVGRVSVTVETVKYGYGFYAIRTIK
jgi:hypothetical protein